MAVKIYHRSRTLTGSALKQNFRSLSTQRHVDATGSACYSFCIEGKPSTVNPRKISLNNPIYRPKRLVIINYVAASGVFVLAIELSYIQKICAPYTLPFSPPGIIRFSL